MPELSKPMRLRPTINPWDKAQVVCPVCWKVIFINYDLRPLNACQHVKDVRKVRGKPQLYKVVWSKGITSQSRGGKP